MNTIKSIIRNIVMVAGLSAAVVFAQSWSGPTATPPGNNTPAPINVSATSQSKSGGLWVGSLGVSGGATVGGSVGIGTISPVAKLDVVSNENSTAIRLLSGSNAVLDIKPTGPSPYNTVLDTVNNRNLILKPGSGKVGISTTNPQGQLDIASAQGDINGSAIRATYPGGGGLAGTEFGALAHRNVSGAGIWNAIYAKGGTGGANALYADGTVVVNGPLTLDRAPTDTGRLYIYYDKTTYPSSYYTQIMQSPSTALSIWGYSGTNDIIFATQNKEDMRISNGKVGIGTPNPNYKLHVAGDVYGASLTTGNYIYTANPTYALVLAPGGNEKMRINATDGNVGIGTDNPSQKLDVAGYVKGTALCIGSDCRTSWPSGGGGGGNVTGFGTAGSLTKWSSATAVENYSGSNTCLAGTFTAKVNSDGTVNCIPVPADQTPATQKICISDSTRVFTVPNTWTQAQCQSINTVFGGGRYQPGCIFASAPYYSISVGTIWNDPHAPTPSPNCGWD